MVNFLFVTANVNVCVLIFLIIACGALTVHGAIFNASLVWSSTLQHIPEGCVSSCFCSVFLSIWSTAH